MSITFMPADNDDYCRVRKLTRQYEFSCQCLGFSETGAALTGCHDCDGTGTVAIPYNPFEMNVSNGNGWSILLMLGQTPRFAGSADPSDLLAAVTTCRTIRPALCVRYKMDLEQVDRYLDGIQEVAQAAMERHVSVVWA